MSKFRPQLQPSTQSPSQSVVAANPDRSEIEQVTELRARSGIDDQERVPEPQVPPTVESDIQEETQVSDSLPAAPENRSQWLLIATAAVALFSLAGIVVVGFQMHEVSQALRQIKEVSDSAGKSAKDAETAARAAESAIKSQLIKQETAAESNTLKPARAAIRKSRARK